MLLLGSPSKGTQQRAAQALCALAAHNPGSPVIIVNAGAISPLVNLLAMGAAAVKEEAANTLSTLAFNSPSTQLAIATGIVAIVGTGSADAQEHVTHLLLKLATDPANRVAIAKAGAIQRLVVQLRGGGQTSMRAQELTAAALASLSGDSDENVKLIASAGGIKPLVTLRWPWTCGPCTSRPLICTKYMHLHMHTRLTGGIKPLVALLGSHSSEAQARSAAVLSDMGPLHVHMHTSTRACLCIYT